MELSIYFPHNQPKTVLLQYPKNGFWIVKKPLPVNNIIQVPTNLLSENPTKEKQILIYRVGRHKPYKNGFFAVEALPLFLPNKNLKND